MATTDEQDTTRATNDAYTGMLAISLIALLAGCALLYLDWSQYSDKDPPKNVKAPAPQFVAPADTGGQKQFEKDQLPPKGPGNVLPPMQDKGPAPVTDKKGG